MEKPRIPKKEWMASKHMELVTAETLDRVVDECITARLFAWDIETTGLDNRVFFAPDGTYTTVDHIVGHCFSPDGHKGYYLPVRHVTDKGDLHSANVPLALVNKALQRLCAADVVAIFHNGKFDHEFLQFGESVPLGEWDNPDSFEDTLVLAYLRNTRERNKGLKMLSKVELDMEMLELDELFTPDQLKSMGGKKNFSLLDPTWEPALWYASSDAICTYLLYHILHPTVVSPEPHGVSQATVYKLEKMCLPATRWMERNRIHIDRAKVSELIQLGQTEWFDALEDVYDVTTGLLGRDTRPGWYRLMRGLVPDVPSASEFIFDPSKMKPSYTESRDEAIQAALRLRLDPTTPNASGKEKVVSIVKEVPSLLHKKEKEKVAFPMVYDVTIPDQLGSLLRELNVPGLKVTAKSGQVQTDGETLDYVIENLSEQFPFMRKIKRLRENKTALANNLFPIQEALAPERSPDGTIRVAFNGYKVDTGRFATPKPREKGGFSGQAGWNLHSIPATYDKNKPACMLRIRECVAARKGKVLFAVDYSGVELRIATNISREPKWLSEFYHCSGCDHNFQPTPENPPTPFCPKCGSDKIGDLHTLTALSIYGEGIAESSEFKAKRQASKCVHPDTLIQTEQGRIRIGDLPLGKVDTFFPVEGVQVLNPQGLYTPVKEVYNGGVKPLFHIVTRRGVLTCSGTHRVVLDGGALQSIDMGLQVGDVLANPVGNVDTQYLQDGEVPSWMNTKKYGQQLQSLGDTIRQELPLTTKNLELSTKDPILAGLCAEVARTTGCQVMLKIRPTLPGYIHVEIGQDCLRDIGQPNEVLQIISGGEGPCVDLHVDSEDHLYVANGLGCHNSLNFAMAYGGGGSAAQRAVGVDKDEGWRIKRQFDKSYPGLKKWWEAQHNFARRYKYVTTAFGRRYPLPDIDHEMGHFRSKAERNSTNGPIQGTSADITKLAMALVFLLCKERGWLRKVLMTITIHDELVFEIDEDIAEEAVYLIVEAMTRNKYLMRLKHPVNYKCDVEFGADWTVPYNLTEMTWNHSKKPWTKRWANVFRKSYAQYLQRGGTPVEGVEVIEDIVSTKDDLVVHGTPSPKADGEPVVTTQVEAYNKPQTGKGVVLTHVIHSSKFSYGLMNTLAEVIIKSADRGLETLRVVDETGEVLWEDPTMTISATIFKVLAEEYRL